MPLTLSLLFPPCPCFLLLYQWQGLPTPMPLDNHPGWFQREKGRERRRDGQRWLPRYIWISHLTRVSWQRGKREENGVEKGGGRRRGGEFLMDSQKLLACLLAVIGAGQQKLLLFLMRFGNWLPQDLPFSACFFRSLLSAGCGDKI